MIDELDYNEDGQLDELELMQAAMVADPSGATVEKAKALFAASDIDADGRLDALEVELLLERMQSERAV